jgi:hypothetical protein
MKDHFCVAQDVKLGASVKLSKFINLYGCEIGANSKRQLYEKALKIVL